MKIYSTQPQLVRAASIFTSTGSWRPYLKGIHFCQARQGGIHIVATDGHRMSVGYDSEGRIEDQPENESAIIRFPRDFLKYLKPTNKLGRPLALAVDEQTATLNSIDSDDIATREQVAVIDWIDGTFPDWRRTIPDVNTHTAAGGFDTKYLADFKAVSTALGDSTNGRIHFIGDDPTAPHIVRLSGQANWFGVIMPMHGEVAALPDWYIGAKPEAEEKKAA